ncbi:homeobox-domain-containing protein [Anaeromyces robustus]|uniref:Homeobox-domain-containing protein n=1 Tax=Anaeromyces robustus TaxID=1754192 RepID=A0A1Y1XKP1_9FUNG|nr:homeobox-domain-containing protein [Anaeromyces robustus]|eukprot:ORX85914.1 homeobox-domain-containing protein [Anaeromyces robustus]
MNYNGDMNYNNGDMNQNDGQRNNKKFSFVNVTLNPPQKNGNNNTMERSINYKQKRKIINKTQYNELMRVFQITEKPSHDERARLARVLGMSVREVQVWFQNRRAKNKKGARNRANTPPFISYKPGGNGNGSNNGSNGSNYGSEADSDKSSKGSPSMQKVSSIYSSIADSNEYIKTTFSYNNNNININNNNNPTPSTYSSPIPNNNSSLTSSSELDHKKILPNPSQGKNSPTNSPSKPNMMSNNYQYQTPNNNNNNNNNNNWKNDQGQNSNSQPLSSMPDNENYPTPQPSPPHDMIPHDILNTVPEPRQRGRPKGHPNKKEKDPNASSSTFPKIYDSIFGKPNKRIKLEGGQDEEIMAAAEALTSLSSLFGDSPTNGMNMNKNEINNGPLSESNDSNETYESNHRRPW